MKHNKRIGYSATFRTLGASNHALHEREKNDYYASAPSVINALFSVEDFADEIIEPACGEGHLSKRMEELGKRVISTDLVDRGYGVGGVNFLDYERLPNKGNQDIITNPPYKLAQDFVEKSLELLQDGCKCAMFLKLTFCESEKRRELFDKYPPKRIYVFSKRQKCALNGDFENIGSSAVCYAWFVWVKGDYKNTELRWI